MKLYENDMKMIWKLYEIGINYMKMIWKLYGNYMKTM